jgi:predicted phosphate transport protein (TIGR00153 family)
MRLTPRAQTFYELFAEAGANAHAAATVAEAIFREWPNGPSQEEIRRLEHEGDRITTELITNLNQQLIAPFDPDDMFLLTGAIDDVVDAIENACELLGLYDVETPTKQSFEQCRILVAATGRLELLLGSLKRRRHADELLVEIKLLEDEGDRVRRAAVAALFKSDRIDPLIVIRWKSIYEALEDAVDACETVAHRVGNILVKNA